MIGTAIVPFSETLIAAIAELLNISLLITEYSLNAIL